MRVIVAGGSGFVGRHVIEALVARGHAGVVLARRPPRLALPGVGSVSCDVAGETLPLAELAGCDAVVNLVGIKREQGRQSFEAVHVEATRRLIQAARSLGIRRFVHVGVVCSRPDPTSPYHEVAWSSRC